MTGASEPEVNGNYEFVSISRDMNGSCLFEKPGVWKGAPVTFSIYQYMCTVGSGERARDVPHWFLSILGSNTNDDSTSAASPRSNIGDGAFSPSDREDSGAEPEAPKQDVDFYSAQVDKESMFMPHDTLKWTAFDDAENDDHSKRPAPSVKLIYLDDFDMSPPRTPVRSSPGRSGARSGSAHSHSYPQSPASPYHPTGHHQKGPPGEHYYDPDPYITPVHSGHNSPSRGHNNNTGSQTNQEPDKASVGLPTSLISNLERRQSLPVEQCESRDHENSDYYDDNDSIAARNASDDNSGRSYSTSPRGDSDAEIDEYFS